MVAVDRAKPQRRARSTAMRPPVVPTFAVSRAITALAAASALAPEAIAAEALCAAAMRIIPSPWPVVETAPASSSA